MTTTGAPESGPEPEAGLKSESGLEPEPNPGAGPEPEFAARPQLGRTASRTKDTIQRLITDGVFAVNQKLPGERELADLLKVSRSVLRNALSALAAEGVLESSPWRGWFVRGQQVAERVELTSFTEMALRRGMRPSSRVLHSEVRPSTEEEAQSLLSDAPVLEVRRLRSLDGRAACLDVSVMPVSRATALIGISLEDASLYAMIESVAGVRIVRSDYTIRSAAADSEIASILGIADGDPLLIGEEIAYDTGGTAMLLGQASYRSEMYRFQATLFRSAERSGKS